MRSAHVGFEQQAVGVGFQIAQLSHPLCRFEILHLGVGKRSEHQQMRVGLRPYIVVRRVLFHVLVLLGDGRIAPFGVFPRGERNAGVAHGGEHVDKRHAGNDAPKLPGRHISHGAHQQAARRTAAGKQAVGMGVFFCAKGGRAIDKIGEGVHFAQHFPVFIPAVAHFGAAPYVGNGHHKPAVEQAEGLAVERGIVSKAVGAVTDEQAGRAAVAFQPPAVGQRNRHGHTVGRLGPDKFGAVVRRIEAAQHRLGFAQRLLPAAHVVVENRPGRFQRRKAVAQHRRVELGILNRPGRVRRLAKIEVMLLPVGPADDAQLVKTVFALGDHQIVFENLKTLQQHFRPVGQQLGPVLRPGLGHWGFQEPEIARLPVGPDQKLVVPVVDCVVKPGLFRAENVKAGQRRAGVEKVGFEVVGIAVVEENVAPRFGFGQAQVQRFVFFLKNQRLAFAVAAEAVAPDLVGAQGGGVFGFVKQVLVVVGPGRAAGRDAGKTVGQDAPRFQIEDAAFEQVAAAEIDYVKQQPVVRTDLQAGSQAVFLAFCQRVHVEHDLLGRLQAAFFPAKNRVLLALRKAGVIPVAVFEVGYRVVVLLNAGFHFIKQRLLQIGYRRQHRVGVAVFGFQVSAHGRVVALVQPVVVVDARVAVGCAELVRLFFSFRGGKLFRMKNRFRHRKRIVCRWRCMLTGRQEPAGRQK